MNQPNVDVQFIDHLRSFLHEGGRQGDRGKLAALRRGLGQPPGAEWRMYPVLGPFLSDHPWQDWPRFVVASLFALHPCHNGEAGTLGKVCRQLGDRESAEKRFVALLSSHRDELPDRLRHVISLAKSANLDVNYVGLLRALRSWDHPNHWVQERWARDYWRHHRTEETTSSEQD